MEEFIVRGRASIIQNKSQIIETVDCLGEDIEDIIINWWERHLQFSGVARGCFADSSVALSYRPTTKNHDDKYLNWLKTVVRISKLS